MLRTPLRYGVAIGCVLALTASIAADQRHARQDADRFDAKLTRIVSLGNAVPRGSAAPRTTEITDRELNAYLEHHGREQIPAGILEPAINALGNGRVSGRAVVDLDAVRQQKQRGWMDPMNYMSGRLPVTATGTLTTKEGIGRFTLESAEVSGVAVPKALIQELVSYYSRTPENPSGISMDDAFELPAQIREIRVGKAQSIVVQ